LSDVKPYLGLTRLVPALVLGLMACGGEFAPIDDGPDVDAGPDQAAREDYQANVEPIMVAKCYNCHAQGQVGAPVFGNYDQVVSYAGEEAPLVACTKEMSRLYTKGAHVDGAAPAFDAATEAPKVAAFIDKWALSKPEQCMGMMGGGAATGSLTFAAGANTVDLSGVANPALTGATITFDAAAVGGGLYLSAINVTAGAVDLKIKNPRFETCPMGSAVVSDPTRFAGVDITIPAGTTQVLGPGTLTIVGAGVGQQFGIRFEILASAAGGDTPVDGGGACTP
jgi:cytochrome c5